MTALVHVGFTEEEVRRLRPLVVGSYVEARARGWPYLSDLLEVRLRGTAEEDRGVVASAVQALARYDRLVAFASGSDLESDRLDALFALARAESTQARQTEERLSRIASPRERLAVRYSFPEWLVAEVDDEALLARMNETAPRVARVNTLKTTREDCLRALTEEGLPVRATERAAHGIVFEGRRSPFRTAAFGRGDFEIQDEASQLVAELVAPPPRSFVVDACAGAGGKTLALAAALGGKGKVAAVDPARSRVEELRRRARRAGASNVQAIVADLLATLPELGEVPARVLVDAPCSGLGAMRRNPEARWRLRPGDLERLTGMQARLTAAAASLVGPNGRVIYATCSFLRREGEGIVEAFLAGHPGFAVMTVRDVMGRTRTDGVATPDGKYLRTWQSGGGGDASMDGFFAAVLRRVV